MLTVLNGGAGSKPPVPPGNGRDGDGGPAPLSPFQLELIGYMRMVMPNKSYRLIQEDVNAIQSKRYYTYNQIKKGLWYWRKHALQIGDQPHYVGETPEVYRFQVIRDDYDGPPFVPLEELHLDLGMIVTVQKVVTITRQASNMLAWASSYLPTAAKQTAMEEASDDLMSQHRHLRRILNDMKNGT